MLQCHDAASGPVSASPSPITHATTRSDYLKPRHRHAPTRSRVRDLRELSLAFPARHGLGSRRKGKLSEQLAQAIGVAADVGIDFAVAALELGVRHHAGSAVTWAADVDDVEIAGADYAVEVGIDEVQPGCGAPMSQQLRLDVVRTQRLVQQSIVQQIDLPNRKIVRGASVTIDQVQLIVAQRGFTGV